MPIVISFHPLHYGHCGIEDENVIAAKRAGVNNYIVKPFNAQTLKAKIDAVSQSRCINNRLPPRSYQARLIVTAIGLF